MMTRALPGDGDDDDHDDDDDDRDFGVNVLIWKHHHFRQALTYWFVKVVISVKFNVLIWKGHHFSRVQHLGLGNNIKI